MNRFGIAVDGFNVLGFVNSHSGNIGYNYNAIMTSMLTAAAHIIILILIIISRLYLHADVKMAGCTTLSKYPSSGFLENILSYILDRLYRKFWLSSTSVIPVQTFMNQTTSNSFDPSMTCAILGSTKLGGDHFYQTFQKSSLFSASAMKS